MVNYVMLYVMMALDFDMISHVTYTHAKNNRICTMDECVEKVTMDVCI